MGIEALWTVEFKSLVENVHDSIVGFTGVIVLETGKVFGGDSWRWYQGHYGPKDPETGHHSFTLSTHPHPYPPPSAHQFATFPQTETKNYVGILAATPDLDLLTLELRLLGDPRILLLGELTWVADLP